MQEAIIIEQPEKINAQKKYVISNFYEILQALRENPEWLEELRKIILTSELIELPKKFNAFVESFEKFKKEEFQPLSKKVDKIEKDVEVLKQDVAVLKQDVAVLKQDVAVLKQDVAVLKQDVAVLKQDVAVLKQDVAVLKQDVEILKKDVENLKKDVGVLKVDVASLKGDNFERKIRERAPAYFGNYFKKVRVIDISDWAEKLDEAEEQGLISEEEAKKALKLDVLIRCKSRKENKDLLLAVEASYTADSKDAERALERADIFYKVYMIETIPVVISREFSPKLEEIFKEVLFIRVDVE
ncbi:hypothetical protein [Thermodesulfovibrio sp.]|uniref:hypothetical protein n=1 Tax=Thermodesulfovibrio sp. TaxID=2067987 RepID=UPI0030AA5D44